MGQHDARDRRTHPVERLVQIAYPAPQILDAGQVEGAVAASRLVRLAERRLAIPE